MELSALKRDLRLLLAVLGIQKHGVQFCPFHNDSNKKSFSVHQESDGVWTWKCFGGCGQGTIIDAAMRVYKAATCQDALREIEAQLGVKILRDEDYQEPRIDAERAGRFVIDAHNLLMNSTEIQQQYLIGKRGINNLETVKEYKLGFAVDVQFGYKNWKFTGWSIPVTDHSGNLLAVKLHAEKQLWPGGPKCLWAPFGTYPIKEPKHGTFTLWPAPEAFADCERLYLCPGELKALVMRSAGFCATSPTSGENKFPQRLIDRLARCAPGSIFITRDNDKAGEKWCAETIKALADGGLTAYAFDFSEHDSVVGSPRSDTVGRDSREPVEPVAAQPTSKPNAHVPKVSSALPPWDGDSEWGRLEDKIVRENEERGLQTFISPEATTEDLRVLHANSQPVPDRSRNTTSKLV